MVIGLAVVTVVRLGVVVSVLSDEPEPFLPFPPLPPLGPPDSLLPLPLGPFGGLVLREVVDDVRVRVLDGSVTIIMVTGLCVVRRRLVVLLGVGLVTGSSVGLVRVLDGSVTMIMVAGLCVVLLRLVVLLGVGLVTGSSVGLVLLRLVVLLGVGLVTGSSIGDELLSSIVVVRRNRVVVSVVRVRRLVVELGVTTIMITSLRVVVCVV